MCPWIGYNISYTHADNMCAVLNATQRNCTTDCAFFTNGVFQDLQLPIGQVYLPTAYLLANLAARAYATAFYNLPANANRQFEMRFSDYSFPMGLKATNFLFFESKFKYQTQSILATSDDDAVVLFRGTETTSDILFTDVATSCTSQSIIPNVGCLHDGFFQAFKVSYADTELALHRLLRLKNLSQSSAKIMYDGLGPTNGSIITTPPPQRRVWVAGHSLGGALAVLFATYAKGRGFNIAGVVSIGQPRVGKQQFVDAYTAMGLHNKTYRFVHRDDPIPMVPPESLGYRHAGQRFVVDSGSVTYRGDEGCINTFLGVCKVVLGDHMTPGYLNSMRSAIASSKVLESCAVNLLPASNDGF